MTQDNNTTKQSKANRQLRVCKAKIQKRKFIEKQSQHQLNGYKLRMLNLVRKRSSEYLEQAQKRINNMENQMNLKDDDNLSRLIKDCQNKINLIEGQDNENGDQLIADILNINKQIENGNTIYHNFVHTFANKIEQICLECISR